MDEHRDWYDPTSQLIDINTLRNSIRGDERIKMTQVLPIIEEIANYPSVQKFLEIAKMLSYTLIDKDSINYCPDDSAFKNADIHFINKYIEHVDPSRLDGSGNNLLHYSIIQNHPDIQRCLQSRPNLDINMKDSDGDTPLHLAVKMGSIESIRLLIKSHPDFTICDSNEKTPKQLAHELYLTQIYNLLDIAERHRPRHR
jgi:hypothetical protein